MDVKKPSLGMFCIRATPEFVEYVSHDMDLYIKCKYTIVDDNKLTRKTKLKFSTAF